MGIKALQTIAALVVVASPGLCGLARAQTPPLPPAATPPLALEVSEASSVPPSEAAPPAPLALGGRVGTRPTAQSASSQGSTISELQNPFEWNGGGQYRRGLFDGRRQPVPRPSGQPVAPPKAPPAYPPEPGAQGLPRLPGTEAMPGSEGGGALTPGAGGEGAGTPGMTMPGGAAPTAPGAGGAPGLAEAGGVAGALSAEEGPGLGGGLGARQEVTPAMIGDMSPYRLVSPALVQSFQRGNDGTPVPPYPPGPRAGQLFYPTVRVFKISENMSPRPQDRVFFNMNTYWNVNADSNRSFDVPIKNITAYRYVFGFEKTFNDGKGSVGLRLPIDNLTADSTVKGFSTPTSTAMGNLTVFTKYILEEDPKSGSLISTGLAITPPTGPGRFAGAPWIFGMNSTYIQPYLGYIWNRGKFYLQGFSAFDFPTTPRDVSLIYNDIGMGYYLHRSNDPYSFVTAVAPTFEVHVNSPMNHRDFHNPFDLAASPDVVNLTYGINFEFNRQAVLSTALITPVTGPRPFSAELAILFNVYFGRTRANRMNITPPPIF